ncbi:unnamed protein product [Symbiodinium sp. CCMP2456]|nr:unnamed protein product [Symbiodinium sp. CCMP2456]
MVFLQMMEYQKQDIDERWFADERYVQGGFFGTRLLGAPATHVLAFKALGFLAPEDLGPELIEQSLRICIKAVVDMEMELRDLVKEVDQEDGAFCAGALLGWLRFIYRFPAAPPPAQAIVGLKHLLAAARKMLFEMNRRIAKLWPMVQKTEELLRRYGEDVDETRLREIQCSGCVTASDMVFHVAPWVPQHHSRLPAAGLGLAHFERNDRATALACDAFLDLNGRLFDTAFVYEQQQGIQAAAIAKAIPRSAVTVISKVPLSEAQEVELAISQTAQQLGGYADVLLLHTPGRPLGDNATFPSCAAQGSWKECRLLAWRQLMRAQQDGLAKEIGVSNFDCSHLREIEAAGLPMPLYNQIEVSAACPMNEELRLCQVAHGIHTLAYSPLGGAYTPRLREQLRTSVSSVAARLGRSSEQVLLRYVVQRYDAVVLPGASSVKHMAANLDLFRFELTKEDVDAISASAPRECAYPMYQPGQIP